MRTLLVALLVLIVGGTAEAGTRRIRVLTFNIKGLPLPGIDKGRTEKIGKRLKELRAKGEGFDIVLLQEVFNRKARKVNQYAEFPYEAWGPQGVIFPAANSGLLLLSEHPILQAQKQKYRHAVGFDALSRKGVLYTEIAIPGLPEPLPVLDTHMQAGRGNFPFLTDKMCDRVRDTQLVQARDFLMSHLPHGAAAIFGGDFNFRPASGTGQYGSFAHAIGFNNAVQDCQADSECSYPTEVRPWENVVDHIFYTPSARHLRIRPVLFRTRFDGILEPQLSDHMGREIQLDVEWDG